LILSNQLTSRFRMPLPLPESCKYIGQPGKSEFARALGNFKYGRWLGPLLRVLQFIPRVGTRLRGPQNLYDEIQLWIIPKRTGPALPCRGVPSLRRSTIEDFLSSALTS